MVDAGTAYHVATMLRNRTSEHVARRILEHWVLHYGAPEMFAIDLGGEFVGVFLDMCEEFNIDVKAAGGNAHWQHGLAERHGGILGPRSQSQLVVLRRSRRSREMACAHSGQCLDDHCGEGR